MAHSRRFEKFHENRCLLERPKNYLGEKRTARRDTVWGAERI